jgi:hypothetical protein
MSPGDATFRSVRVLARGRTAAQTWRPNLRGPQPSQRSDFMEPNEPSEMISEIEEEMHAELPEHPAHKTEDHHHSGFRSFAAVWVAILAALMAIRGVGAEQAKDEMIAKNIQASDTWSHYQAKNLRQTSYRIAADQITADLASPGLSAAQRVVDEKRLGDYQKQIKRYDSEAMRANDPQSGGKKEIAERAKDYENERDVLDHKNHNFNFAEMFFQLGLVLASVSILLNSRKLLAGSIVLGALGAILTINGFFWIVQAIG